MGIPARPPRGSPGTREEPGRRPCHFERSASTWKCTQAVRPEEACRDLEHNLRDEPCRARISDVFEVRATPSKPSHEWCMEAAFVAASSDRIGV